MPIRINLLAESQAAEELRRRDPVKRALFIAGAWAGIMIAVSCVVQSQVLSANRRASGIGDRIRAVTNDYSAVVANLDRAKKMQDNRRGLDLLASERFLHGSLLNALQKTTLDGVQLVRVKTEFGYTLTEESRAKTNINVILKHATSAERVNLVIEARDASANPGDLVARFKDTVARSAPILGLVGTNSEIRLVNLAPPMLDPGLGRTVVQFALETRLPEKVRYDLSSPVRYAPPKPPGSRATPKPATSDVAGESP